MNATKPPRQRMFAAVHQDDLHAFRAALEAGANLNDQDDNGLAPIHLTTKLRSDLVFDELLARNADVNAISRQGVSALHTAAFNGDMPKVRTLVEHGADIEARNRQDRTPLDLAQGPAHAYLLSVHEQRALEANTAQAPARYATDEDTFDPNGNGEHLAPADSNPDEPRPRSRLMRL